MDIVKQKHGILLFAHLVAEMEFFEKVYEAYQKMVDESSREATSDYLEMKKISERATPPPPPKDLRKIEIFRIS